MLFYLGFQLLTLRGGWSLLYIFSLSPRSFPLPVCLSFALTSFLSPRRFSFPSFAYFSAVLKVACLSPPGLETFPTTVTTQTRKPFQYNNWCKVLRYLAFINPFSMDLPERLDNHSLANAVETAFFPGDTEDWDR